MVSMSETRKKLTYLIYDQKSHVATKLMV